jgi:hypothetical protein
VRVCGSAFRVGVPCVCSLPAVLILCWLPHTMLVSRISGIEQACHQLTVNELCPNAWPSSLCSARRLDWMFLLPRLRHLHLIWTLLPSTRFSFSQIYALSILSTLQMNNLMLPNLASSLQQIQHRDRKTSAQETGAVVRGRITDKFVDRYAAQQQGPAPRPAAVELNDDQKLQHMISTIDIAVPACTAIIGSCIRVSGTVAFISINFKKLFGFEAWEFCHLRGGSRMQVAEYPSIKSGEKILVRIIGREPTPTLG